MKPYDYVIISSIDWTEIRQMPQQLATSLVQSGHRVLFIENTGVRAPRMGDLARITARIRNWLKSTRGFFDVHENLTVFSPLFIPLPYSRLALGINHFLLSSAICSWMRINRFHNPVLITFLPTPLSISIIHDIDPVLTIYYCANDMAGGSDGAAPLREYEDIFFGNVDAVFCNSHALLDRAKIFAKKSFLFPAGVDFEKFENARNYSDIPNDLATLAKPVVGYIGAISRVFDQALVVSAAKAMPHVNFILIGPVYTDVSLLTECANIKLLGKRPHDEVPAYIKGFDLALIPYIKNSFTDAVYSCKLNEYLAMGIPVVASDLFELRYYAEQHGNVLQIATNHDDFINKIFEELDGPSNINTIARIEAARLNSWENRFKSISSVFKQLHDQQNEIQHNWQDRLLSQYRRRRMQVFKFLIFSFAFYILVFYTPLIWFFGDKLTVRHQPRAADAIVVFSGDGESSYINQSYQRRTIDAIHYFKSGYAPLIILSSGRDQTISEVELIRSLLINRQVSESSIKILNKYPRSTFENVAMVKDILISNNVRSILLITSPYHSRRALWVWKKAMPEINVIAPMVIDTPKPRPHWTASLDQIRVIAYEYAAIAYYYSKGWI